MKKKVYFDGTIFTSQKYGGISRYFCELHKNLTRLDQNDFDYQIIAPAHENGHLNEHQPKTNTWIAGSLKKTLHPKMRRVTNEVVMRLATAVRHPSIIHETYYRKKSSAWCSAKTIVTVYDMIHEKLPHYFHSADNTTKLKKAAINRADGIICISESTKTDLVNIYDCDRKPVRVIPLGCYQSTLLREERPPRNERPFILYVGRRNGYKNFTALLHAYANVPRLKHNLALICFGGPPFSENEREQIASLGLTDDHVKHTTGTDETLSLLYRRARGFIYPSLYEGFGLPILEAMTLGCPVACSNTSSMPEIGGDAAVYFDPTSQDSIAQAIEMVAFDEDIRKTLAEASTCQARHFSWKRCAAETQQFYKEALT